MEDHAIIDLYWAREERALEETDRKYGAYCRTVARNILRSPEDTEECVNDTWLRAWNTMPPQRPGMLGAFLGKITRNLSLDRCRLLRADKRGGGSVAVALEELGDCVSAGDTVEEAVEYGELTRLLDAFLRQLPEKECCLFLRRYWYLDSLRDMSLRFSMTEGSVKAMLFRTRTKLRTYLAQQEIYL